jgi:hypothetical protein
MMETNLTIEDLSRRLGEPIEHVREWLLSPSQRYVCLR